MQNRANYRELTVCELADIAAIARTKYAYLRALDTHDWSALSGLLTKDVSMHCVGGDYDFSGEGRDHVVAMLASAMHDQVMSCHTVHHPVIEVDGDVGTGEWLLRDWLLDARRGLTTTGAAFYRDEYVRCAGNWLIRHWHYMRLFERVTPMEDLSTFTALPSWWAANPVTTPA